MSSSKQNSTAASSHSGRGKSDIAWGHISEGREHDHKRILPLSDGDMLDADSEKLHPPCDKGASGSRKRSGSTMANEGKKKGATGIGDYFATRTNPGAQHSPNKEVDMAFARFFYDACIPINALNSIYLQPLVEAIAAIGPGYKAPTYHAMRANLLRDAKKEVQLLIEIYKNRWADGGCTLVADCLNDNRQRSLVNFLVYCPRGMFFVKSVDASDVINNAQTLMNLFEEMVLWIGTSNVVHIVTNNGSNFEAAGRILSEKYRTISWSPCAANCLNLMLKDIAELNLVDNLVQRVSQVTKFVYNRTLLIAWLRKREGWTEIVRPGATCFATTFLVLRSIHEHKHDLQAMVTDIFFVKSEYAKSKKGKEVVSIILDTQFWNDINIILKIVGPLMRMLHIVDSNDKPSIGYVYEGMYRARLGIKKLFSFKKRLYKPYIDIIKARWDRILRQDIHAAAYWLNPAFQYEQSTFCTKPEVLRGLLHVIEAKATSSKTKVWAEARLFQDRLESFARPLALETCKTLEPDEWWRLFGTSAPNLQTLAIQVLSQTSASLGCERNWSVFERIHTKKRNKLEHQRLNDLVYVHYNLRLQNRVSYKKLSFDPIDYESINKTEFWIVDGEDECGELDYDELEKMLCEERSIPIADEHTSQQDGEKDDVVDIQEGMDLRSFGDGKSGSSSNDENSDDEW